MYPQKRKEWPTKKNGASNKHNAPYFPQTRNSVNVIYLFFVSSLDRRSARHFSSNYQPDFKLMQKTPHPRQEIGNVITCCSSNAPRWCVTHGSSVCVMYAKRYPKDFHEELACYVVVVWEGRLGPLSNKLKNRRMAWSLSDVRNSRILGNF